jgi:hypothetical protein
VDEQEKTIAKLPRNDEVGDNPDKVVVGVCCWKLEDGSKRKGHFQHPDGNHSLSDDICSDADTSEPADKDKHPKPEKSRDRDLNTKHTTPFDKVCEAAEEKFVMSYPPPN